MIKELRKVTFYLSVEEHAGMKALAEDEGVTVSAIVRAQLGLAYKRRGAPEGNRNRQPAVSARGQHRVVKAVDADHE